MNFIKKYVNLYFAALWPELLSKHPVSFFLDTLEVSLKVNFLEGGGGICDSI